MSSREEEIKITFNQNCPACMAVMSLQGEPLRESNHEFTYWTDGAYHKEVRHLQEGVWPCSVCEGIGCSNCEGLGIVALHDGLLVGGIHENLLNHIGSLLYQYNNGGNQNVLLIGGEVDCYACDGSGKRGCRSCDDEGIVECYDCEGEGKEEGQPCDNCKETGELTCTDCEGETDCVECEGYGQIEDDTLITGITPSYQDVFDEIRYDSGLSNGPIIDALDRLESALNSGQVYSFPGSQMYNETNYKLYNDLHDAIAYYVINEPNRPIPAESDTLEAESFESNSRPTGVSIKNHDTTSSVYYNLKRRRTFTGKRHKEQAHSYAQFMLSKLKSNPNYHNFYSAETFEAEERQVISELVCSSCGIKDEIANYQWDENTKSKCCGKWLREKRYFKKSDYITKYAESEDNLLHKAKNWPLIKSDYRVMDSNLRSTTRYWNQPHDIKLLNSWEEWQSLTNEEKYNQWYYINWDCTVYRGSKKNGIDYETYLEHDAIIPKEGSAIASAPELTEALYYANAQNQSNELYSFDIQDYVVTFPRGSQIGRIGRELPVIMIAGGVYHDDAILLLDQDETFEADSQISYYSTGNVHRWIQFLNTECEERGNYDYDTMKKLESKYNLNDNSAVIWVSEYPEVAASYEISQGIIHNNEQSVIDDWGFSKNDLKTTKFGQIYLPTHMNNAYTYQGTIMPETDDGEGGYLLSLNRDETRRRRLNY